MTEKEEYDYIEDRFDYLDSFQIENSLNFSWGITETDFKNKHNLKGVRSLSYGAAGIEFSGDSWGDVYIACDRLLTKCKEYPPETFIESFRDVGNGVFEVFCGS